MLSKVDKTGKVCCVCVRACVCVSSLCFVAFQGVYVQASTLGALEALLQFLADSKVCSHCSLPWLFTVTVKCCVKIPVSGVNIGPVHRKDVMKAAVMLEFKQE